MSLPTSDFIYTPYFIRTESDLYYGDTVSHEDYNYMFNVNRLQGDTNTEALRMLFTEADETHAPRIPYVDANLNTLYTQLQVVSNKEAAFEDEVHEALEGVDTQISGLTTDITNINTHLDGVDSDLFNINNDVSTIYNHLNTVDSAIAGLNTAMQNKQDKLIAGANITITNNVISSTGGGSSYDDTELRNLIAGLQSSKQDKLTAGDNITITGNVISATGESYDDTELRTLIAGLQASKQDTLTAGTNISIVDNVISSTIEEYDDTEVRSLISGLQSSKQNTLVSGTNIKTINDQSLLGSGNIVIQGGTGVSDYTQLTNKPSINGTVLVGDLDLSDLNIQDKLSTTNLLSPYYVNQDAGRMFVSQTQLDEIATTFYDHDGRISTLADNLGVVSGKLDVVEGNVDQCFADMATMGNDLISRINAKQDTLVSGTNIKTINNQSLLGSGNIDIQGGGGTTDYTDLTNKPQIAGITLTGNKTLANLGIQAVLTAGSNITITNNTISAAVGTSDINDIYTALQTQGSQFAAALNDKYDKDHIIDAYNASPAFTDNVYNAAYINTAMPVIQIGSSFSGTPKEGDLLIAV